MANRKKDGAEQLGESVKRAALGRADVLSPSEQREKTGQRRQVLASVEIKPENNFVISADIFNEPTPERLRNSGKVWVRFFDQNDSYLKRLISTVNNSPTLRRIIEDKTNMVVGDGFIPVQGKATSIFANKKHTPAEGPSLDILEEKLTRVNLHDETLQDILKKAAFDFDAFGNCVLEIVRGETMGEQYCYIYHTPIYYVAIRETELDGVIKSYGIYDAWEKLSDSEQGDFWKKEGFREIAAYPEFSEMEDGTQRSILHLKQYAPGYSYWGLPEWIGARMWAEIEYRIQRFNTSKFENGFVPSGVLQFFGMMTTEEAKGVMTSMENKFTGTGNNSKILGQVIRNKADAAQWIPMGSNQEGEFLELQQLAASAIVVANRWSKSLAGFATSGQLGTNEQIKKELEYLQNTVIKQRQNLFLSRLINPYIALIAETEPSISGIEMLISNSLPVSFMGDINVEANLTLDEKREILGYGPAQKEAENIDQEQLKAMMDAYGVGVRAGAITAQQEDENFFRSIAGFPEASDAVTQVWEAEGVRRPITLKSTEEREAELTQIQNKRKQWH